MNQIDQNNNQNNQNDKTLSLVADLQKSVIRWMIGMYLAATLIGGVLRRRMCYAILPGILLGYASFQVLISLVLRLKGATGTMFGLAILVSLIKFGLLVGAVVFLWYLDLELIELLGGLLASQFAIVGACTKNFQFANRNSS